MKTKELVELLQKVDPETELKVEYVQERLSIVGIHVVTDLESNITFARILVC